VKIRRALPGLTSGYGPSRRATEDVAILRGMPALIFADPCDALDIEPAVPAIATHDGPAWMRLLRGNVPLVTDAYGDRFDLGRVKLICDGADRLVIASGFMTMRALDTAKLLAADRVAVAMLNVPAIKPLDEATMLTEDARPSRSAGGGRLEPQHNRRPRRGGGGEAVAQRRGSAALRPGRAACGFVDAGALPTLHDRYGISAKAMAASIKGWLQEPVGYRRRGTCIPPLGC